MGIRRRLLKSLANTLEFDDALKLAGYILAKQGFGTAGPQFDQSGERATLAYVKGPRPLLVDVGGFQGEYTKLFLDHFPGGRSLMFEPSSANFGRLQETFAERGDVEIVNAAVGRSAGTATLYADSEASALGSLTKRQLDHVGIKFAVSQQVNVKTLDEATAERGITHIDLLKIDVEGHELDVLRGAKGLFERRAVGVAQFEFGGTNLDTHTTLRDFFHYFEPYGYAIHIIRPNAITWPLGAHREIYEQYRFSNYLALPVSPPTPRS